MSAGMFTSAAGMLAEDARADVIANNLANVRTAGFRKDYVTFRQRLDAATGRAVPGLVLDRTTWDRQPGAIDVTGRALDLAIRGEGWFQVRKDGRTLATRAGDFSVNALGVLSTADGGAEVLSSGGEPISVAGVPRWEINERGEVVGPDGVIARVAVVAYDQPAAMEKVGDALFRALPGSQGRLVGTPDIETGALESSSVESVREMVAMIAAFRSYELNAQALRIQDEMLGRAASDVGRLNT